MVTQVRFEGRRVRLALLIGAKRAVPPALGERRAAEPSAQARDPNGHHHNGHHDDNHHDEDARRAQLWNQFRALPADERPAALRKLATGSQEDVIAAFWLTTRLNAGLPAGVAASANGNGLHPPLLLWYHSTQHGHRRYYKGIGKTLQPEFTSEKPQARVLDDLDHAFSVMALCKRAGYSHVTLCRPGDC